jgi:hypothetical protein
MIDDTSAIGTGIGPDLQVQSTAPVGRGARSASAFPPCLRLSDADDAGSECVTVCATVQAGSKIEKVEGFVQDTVGSPKFKPCDGRRCGDANTRARFEPSGWTKQPSRPGAPLQGDQICWGFRNWDPDHGKNAILRVTYSLPSAATVR